MLKSKILFFALTLSVLATTNVFADDNKNNTGAIIFKSDPANAATCPTLAPIFYKYKLDPNHDTVTSIEQNERYRSLILVKGSEPFGQNKTIRSFMNIAKGKSAPDINLYGVFKEDHSQNAGIWTLKQGSTECLGTFISNTVEGNTQ